MQAPEALDGRPMGEVPKCCFTDALFSLVLSCTSLSLPFSISQSVYSCCLQHQLNPWGTTKLSFFTLKVFISFILVLIYASLKWMKFCIKKGEAFWQISFPSVPNRRLHWPHPLATVCRTGFPAWCDMMGILQRHQQPQQQTTLTVKHVRGICRAMERTKTPKRT